MRTFVLGILCVACCLAAGPAPARAGEITGLKATASSFKEWGDPSRLVDNDPATAWVGGRQGTGPGKRMAFTLPEPRTISRLRIANGNQAPGLFGKFRCITAAVLLLPDHAVRWFSLKPEPGEQDVAFPPVTVSSFEILIVEVSEPATRPEPGRDKVAVSEVRVFGDWDDVAPAHRAVWPPASEKTSPAVRPAPAPPAPAPPAPALQKKGTMDYFAATKPGLAWLKTAVPARKGSASATEADSPAVLPWMRELVVGYFKGLVALGNGYLDVFAPSIRERERLALAVVRGEQRAGKLPFTGAGRLRDSGLVLDKAVVRNPSAMVPVHGVCRFEADGKVFEFGVNAQFSFARGEDGWRIDGVLSR